MNEPRQPEGPTDLPARTWRAVVRRVAREARADDLTDWAAALTYYTVLALFPAMIVLVAILGLVGQYPATVNALLKIVGQIGPKSAVDTFREPITGVVRNKGGAGALLGVGLIGSIWSASGYVGAFMRASNAIYGVEEGRPFWKLRPLQLVVTITMVLMTALVAVAITLTGPLARAVGDQIGIGRTAVTAWNYAKWPVLFAVVSLVFAILYYAAPNVRIPRFRWITPGSLLALVVWLATSIGFGVYLANFGSYNATYGTLGAVVVFLVWLWLTNLALLLGVELNAEVERGRELASGDQRADDGIQLEPRAVKGTRRGRRAATTS